MNRNQNVMMILDSLQMGGTETHVLSLAREMQKQGAYVVIVANEGPLREKFEEIGCPLYYIDFDMDRSEYSETCREILSQLQVIIDREKITTIHAHQIPSAYFAFLLAQKHKIPFVMTIHGTYYDIKPLVEMKHHATFIAVSYPLQEWLFENDILSIILPNGIDLHEFQSNVHKNAVQNQLNIQENEKVILYSARLSWEKAGICQELIRACGEIVKYNIPNLRLIIIGTGREEKQIQKCIEETEKKIGKTFTRFLGIQSDPRPFYAMSDLIVGTGRVALEAMACERPVIAAGSRGFLGLIHPHDNTGWYYYFGDHKHLYNCTKENMLQAIKSFLLLPFEARFRIGKESRDLVMRFFNNTMVVSELLHIYQVLYVDTRQRKERPANMNSDQMGGYWGDLPYSTPIMKPRERKKGMNQDLLLMNSEAKLTSFHNSSSLATYNRDQINTLHASSMNSFDISIYHPIYSSSNYIPK